MAAQLFHRGPDDEGEWYDQDAGIAFAHRRLSILDLSSAGKQPMHSRCGRYTIAYNGEIYNHLELRTGLETQGHVCNWRGSSDTETLLAAFSIWGIEKTLERLNGMFAFALWDHWDRKLFLVRDRMGEKPLYYGRNGQAFLFGSELKALKVHPEWQGDIDRDALALYMPYSNVPAPWSIYKSIAKLPPAHFVVISDQGRSISDPICYWDLSSLAEEGSADASGSADQLEEELDQLLKDSIGRRMLSDVPLGAFLSGGYDSTTVTALMQAQSSEPVKTFSIGSYSENDEAHHARAVADHLGTDHTELYVTSEDALSVIPRLPSLYDEPFADSSQIPTFLVSQLARQSVTVALSGDGGDELFAGYNRHAMGPAIWDRSSRLPRGFRQFVGFAMARAAQWDWHRLLRYLPAKTQAPELGTKLGKVASALNARSAGGFYKDLVSHWKHPELLVRQAAEPSSLLDNTDKHPSLPGLREQMLYFDMMTYLPNDILTKVDRASMGVSLEARVPLLDHRLVEFAWRVPTKFKYRDGKGKWLLRQVLYRYVPKELMERPKMGFAVPIGEWLRGSLREWADDLLNEQRLEREGYLHPEPVQKMWQAHLAGKRGLEHQLWNVLMFQAWLETER